MQKFLKNNSQLQNVCLPPTKKIDDNSSVAKIWNNYGGLLEVLSKTLNIEPAIAASVLCVESSGKGFEDCRVIIRFENHIFWKYWGKSHEFLFNDHFAYDKKKPWTNHLFRGKLGDDLWKDFHKQGQGGEWEVFKFARDLNEKAAIDSISMGMPQIMGFNFERIGYKSEREMFDVFSTELRSQIIGLFDFIGIGTKMCFALQNKDFLTFAKLYNGSGNAEVYSNKIKTNYESLNTLLKE